MREIKFRAWDKEKKIMIKNLNGWSKGYTEKYDLMQLIGLKDKNDKEIYEGDIVQLKGHDRYIAEVKWDSVSCGFYLDQGDGDWVEDIDFEDHARFEVIGNIYENPELIK